MNNPQRLRLFSVKYIGATNTLASRIKIRDCHFGDSITFQYGKHSQFSYLTDCAQAELKERGISANFQGVLCKGVDFIGSYDFDIRLTNERKTLRATV